jgi:hypothetical protein
MSERGFFMDSLLPCFGIVDRLAPVPVIDALALAALIDDEARTFAVTPFQDAAEYENPDHDDGDCAGINVRH